MLDGVIIPRDAGRLPIRIDNPGRFMIGNPHRNQAARVRRILTVSHGDLTSMMYNRRQEHIDQSRRRGGAGMTWWQWVLTIAGAWLVIGIVVAGLSGLVIRGWQRGTRIDASVDTDAWLTPQDDVNGDTQLRPTPSLNREDPDQDTADERLLTLVGHEHT